MMTLKESIKHCKDVALSCTNKECALEHFQLLKWLQEYSNMLKNQDEQKSEKVKPKFNEGDWITNKHGEAFLIGYIDKENARYVFEIGGYSKQAQNYETIEFADKHYHLWTIQDAKDGNVLVTTHDNGIGQIIFIFKRVVDDDMFCYCLYDSEMSDKLCFDPCTGSDFIGGVNGSEEEFHPATKEQRDYLFQKMTEAGYEWDAEKKELKMIEQNSIEWKQDNIKDLTEFESAMMHIGGSFFGNNAGLDPNDTDAIKEQANLLMELVPKQEWSEEDEILYESALWHVKNSCGNGGKNSGEYEVYNWLKSLKDRVQPQNHWKPSEKQIGALEKTLKYFQLFNAFGETIDNLKELHQQLKKL